MSPLITVLIATKDRPDDLRRTLGELRKIEYPALEVIVIDDGSTAKLEGLVREEWPTALFVREDFSTGQARRRSEGFKMAKGEFILQLDDDSCPTAPDALTRAVDIMTANPGFGALSFLIFNGTDLPLNLPPSESRYAAAFVGCGVLFRTRAILEIGGYQPFFSSEFEEEELGLRVLKAGWAIYFAGDLLVHHHLSPRNRRTSRNWMRNFRNKMWSIVMHYPLKRLPFEASWVLLISAWDSIRLLRVHYFIAGIWQITAGLPRAIGLRKPMSSHTLRIYDALRFRGILTEKDYRNPAPIGFGAFWRWLTKSWMNRARQRSVWDRRAGDIGSSPTVKFAHEFLPPNERKTP